MQLDNVVFRYYYTRLHDKRSFVTDNYFKHLFISRFVSSFFPFSCSPVKKTPDFPMTLPFSRSPVLPSKTPFFYGYLSTCQRHVSTRSTVNPPGRDVPLARSKGSK